MAGSISSGLPALVAWKQLEKSGDVAQAKWSKQATVQQKLAYVQGAIDKAKNVDDLINDRRFMEFALSAFGLESEIDKKGLLSRVLKSDLLDENSLANRMNDSRYKEMASALQFKTLGLVNIKTPAVFESLKARYLKNEFEKSQGEQNPGLREALYFKENVGKVNSPWAILGDRVLREVVTKTLDIPKEFAVQSVETQATVLTKKIDITKFKDKAFVDKFIQRYLNKVDQETQKTNGTGAGLYGGLLQGAGTGGGLDLTGVLDVLQGLGSRRY